MCNRESYAKAKLILSVYWYPRLFNHNMEVGMEVLVDAKSMEESKNALNEKVYGIVASINCNIDYRDQDEDSIDRQFNSMIAIGNLKTKGKPDAKINAKEEKRREMKLIIKIQVIQIL